MKTTRRKVWKLKPHSDRRASRGREKRGKKQKNGVEMRIKAGRLLFLFGIEAIPKMNCFPPGGKI